MAEAPVAASPLSGTLHGQRVPGEAQGSLQCLPRPEHRASFARDAGEGTRGPLSGLQQFADGRRGDKGAGSLAEQRALFTAVSYALSRASPLACLVGLGRGGGVWDKAGVVLIPFPLCGRSASSSRGFCPRLAPMMETTPSLVSEVLKGGSVL